jgi:putative membrane protein
VTTDTAHGLALAASLAHATLTTSDLATTRTLMAADRTLMAWVRTSLSMTSFGFTIYQFLRNLAHDQVVLAHVSAARSIGLFLTGLGTLSMLVGIIEHRETVRTLGLTHRLLFRPTVGIAVLVLALGVLLFLTISVPALLE